MRWCWVNFQCRGVLQFGYSRARAYCSRSRCGWRLFGHFYSHLSFPLSPSLWETARYRLKYCLKGPLNQKQPTNQPTNVLTVKSRPNKLISNNGYISELSTVSFFFYQSNLRLRTMKSLDVANFNNLLIKL